MYDPEDPPEGTRIGGDGEPIPPGDSDPYPNGGQAFSREGGV